MDDHPNIIRFLGLYFGTTLIILPMTGRIATYSILLTIDVSARYYTIFEYADGGTLREYLTKWSDRLTWNDKCMLGLNVTSGLKYLHEIKIIHRNLVTLLYRQFLHTFNPCN